MANFVQTQRVMNNTNATFTFSVPMQVWGVALSGFQFSYGVDSDHNRGPLDPGSDTENYVGQLSCTLTMNPQSGRGTATEVGVSVQMKMASAEEYVQDDSHTFAIVTLLASDSVNDLIVQNVSAGGSVNAPAPVNLATWALAGFNVGNAGTDEIAVTSFSGLANGSISAGNVLQSTGNVALPGVSGPGTADVLLIATALSHPASFFTDVFTVTNVDTDYGADPAASTYTPDPSLIPEGYRLSNLVFFLQQFSMSMAGGDSSEVDIVRAGWLSNVPVSEDGGTYVYGTTFAPDMSTPQSLTLDPAGTSVQTDFTMWRPAYWFNSADQTAASSGTFLVVGLLEPSTTP